MNLLARQKRIIYVLSGYVGEIGGGAKSPLLLCETLSDLGMRVTLFVASVPAPEIRRRLEAHEIKVVVPWIKVGSRWRLQHKLIALQTYLRARRLKPSLIHCYGLSAQSKHLLRLPAVAPIYLWESTEALPDIKFVDAGIHKYLSKAAAVLAPSHKIAENVRRTYRYQGTIKILPFWVEQPPQPQLDSAHSRSCRLMYLGRFDLDKGFEYLAGAFERVQAACPSATLALYGNGDTESVRRFFADNQAVQIRAAVTGQEFEEAFRGSDALVLPSIHEGNPLSLLEASGRYKPLIATAVGAIPELYGGRKCALLVPPRDSASLAQAAITLLTESDDSYRERCQDARRLFDEVNSQALIHRRLLDAYGLSG